MNRRYLEWFAGFFALAVVFAALQGWLGGCGSTSVPTTAKTTSAAATDPPKIPPPPEPAKTAVKVAPPAEKPAVEESVKFGFTISKSPAAPRPRPTPPSGKSRAELLDSIHPERMAETEAEAKRYSLAAAEEARLQQKERIKGLEREVADLRQTLANSKGAWDRSPTKDWGDKAWRRDEAKKWEEKIAEARERLAEARAEAR